MADTATQTAAQTPALATTTANLRSLFGQMAGELMALRSLTEALNLAALQDSAHGDPKLYWPDLLSTLHSNIPNPEKLQDKFDALAKEFVLIDMSMNTNAANAAAAAGPRGRAGLTQSAKATA
ncbi:MAG: hypothetical protein Q8M35_06775 [Pseudohongiella sp.]|nr:hypothetical protein [Pseudohongiella sp.]